MELDIFVQKSLEQILDGINAAKKSKGVNNISPKPIVRVNREQNPQGLMIHEIDFDVAVTIEEKSGGDAGAKISVLGSSLGGKLETESSLKTATRIKFSVPVAYGENT